MNLYNLLTSSVLELPVKRDTGISLSKQIERMFRKFSTQVQALGSSNWVEREIKSHLKLMRSVERGIRAALDAYLSGFPHLAYEEFDEAVEGIASFMRELQAPPTQLGNLYRVRTTEALVQWERKDIFHVPFELRHMVGTERYSISGWPSLYLGGSIVVCWEEMGRPAFHTLSLAAFDAKARVLDFGYTPAVLANLNGEEASFFTPQQMVSYVVCWPLLCSCSISVSHPSAPFKEEYIIPQLLLQWVRKQASDIDGLRYFSTKVKQVSSAPRLAINYVFPVKTQGQQGHCTDLTGKFDLTLPVPWSLLQAIDPRLRSPLRKNEPYVLNDEQQFPLMYDDTDFGTLESRISEMPKRPIV